ncbi:type II secretion system protein [Methylotenera sp.]|uniref:type II secretion system protein n=1 Tax=Methylotenera sp. TaxID=2051956 RepID=UPI00248798D3|nr:type II secretion system protein [Methylotenera sp.]MDI1298996.1 type II secretion system protein [Methylotenera sp.]
MARVMRIGKPNFYLANQCDGFTYIGLMIMVAISGIALAGVGIVWHQDMQREREKELLFIGNAYRQAISSYYENSPSGIKQYPRKLDDLMLDKRFPNIKRHIRRLYIDPIAREAVWGLVLDQERIIGVYSQSSLKPIKRKQFPEPYGDFSGANKYSDWKFTYMPG